MLLCPKARGDRGGEKREREKEKRVEKGRKKMPTCGERQDKGKGGGGGSQMEGRGKSFTAKGSRRNSAFGRKLFGSWKLSRENRTIITMGDRRARDPKR